MSQLEVWDSRGGKSLRKGATIQHSEKIKKW